MVSNYLFIFLLAVFWLISFLLPVKRLKKREKRLVWLMRITFVWWVIGMGYHLLGFLIPRLWIPRFVNSVLSLTLALPCRLGIGFEHFRADALNLARFDLAWAMIWGLPFAFICAALLSALEVQLKKRVPLQRPSFRG